MVAGTRGVLGNCASLRAARIAAAINRTRLRPSSTPAMVHLSLFVRLGQLSVGGNKTLRGPLYGFSLFLLRNQLRLKFGKPALLTFSFEAARLEEKFIFF